MLAVGNDRQFRECVKAIGLPALSQDEAFSTNAVRVQNRQRLVAELDAAFRRKETHHWIQVLDDAGVPCGPINDLADVFTSDYAREQGLVRTQAHPLHVALPTVANPVHFSESAVVYRRPPPLLGEHTDEVLREWLGYSAETVEDLKNSGAI
jgi:crotonobetainyl-CoA:carnitine CoA-transferase CaiB-like acyl-CoA transferase